MRKGFKNFSVVWKKIHLVIYALLLLFCCCCCYFFFIHLESWKVTRSMNITGTDMTYSDKDMSACNKECLPWACCVKFDCWMWMVFHCWLCSILFLSSSLTVSLSLCDMLKLCLSSSHTSRLAFFLSPNVLDCLQPALSKCSVCVMFCVCVCTHRSVCVWCCWYICVC